MRRIVFFDIDGTIWDSDMQIPKSAVSALRDLHKRGVLTYICTGRSRSNLYSSELADLGFDGIVAACGCHIEINGRLFYEKVLPYDFLISTVSALNTFHMPAVMEGPDFCWFDPESFPNDPYIDYLSDFLGHRARRLSKIDMDSKINKFSADILPETDMKGIRDLVHGTLDMIVHGGKVAEFVPAGMSKARGIERVLSELQIPVENSYGIGDGNNDLEMISYVGHGIAMGNASFRLKDRAEFVTTSIHEDGIWNALRHYELI